MWNLKNEMSEYNRNRFRYRKQASGYQWREGLGEGQVRGRGLRGTNYWYKIKRHKDVINVQHRDYSQYFVITLSITYKNIESLCCTSETNITL